MSSNFLKAYKQVAPIKGTNEEQLAFLFNKAAEFINQAQRQYENNQMDMYCESLAKTNNLIIKLQGTLRVNNNASNKVGNNYEDLQNYFAAILTLLTRLPSSKNSDDYMILIGSFRNMAKMVQIKE